MLAFSEGQQKRPNRIESNVPSAWYQPDRGADIVLISPAEFLPVLKPLKELRQRQGYKVVSIQVEDLYDEFSFGHKTPGAIRSFLQRAWNAWQTPPRFVLLVRDASFDPRNRLGLGNFDRIPTQWVEATFLETASDDWFVDFDEDGSLEMAIGRLPVQTPREVATVISKIVGYEESGLGNGTREVLLVADANEGFDFEQASQEIARWLPVPTPLRTVFRGQSGVRAKDELLEHWNRGPLIVNYLGHGSVGVWRGDLFTTADAEELTNGDRLPFVVSLTCLNGFFHDLHTESLAEALLKAEQGGAIGVLASGLTTPAGQLALNRRLFQLLFQGQSMTLGEAVVEAKSAVSSRDFRHTWILFGDPATRLK